MAGFDPIEGNVEKVFHIYGQRNAFSVNGYVTYCGLVDRDGSCNFKFCSDISRATCVDCVRIKLREEGTTAPKGKGKGKGKEKVMATDLKQVLARAAKRGVSTGIVKVISKEVYATIAEEYPAIELLPKSLRDLTLCLIVNQVAASTSLPGASQAEALTAEALESLAAATFEEMVGGLVDKVGPKLARIVRLAKGRGTPEIEE
jgi:hypothetical protein